MNQAIGGGPDRTRRAMLAAVGGNFIWGFSFLFTKLALRSAAPELVVAYRLLFAVLALNAVALIWKVPVSLRGKNPVPLLLLGLCEPILYYVFESYGILYSSATFSGVMIGLIPVVSLGMAALFLREKPGLWQVLFSLVSIGGVVWLSLGPDNGGVTSLLGAALMLGAVLSGAGFGLLNRSTSEAFSPFSRTYWMFTEGFVFFAVLSVLRNLDQPAALLAPLGDGVFWAATLYLGLCSSVLAYFLINYAATYLPVARASSFVNLTTLISIFAGVVLLREPMGGHMPLAAAMILLGIWGVQRFARPSAGPSKRSS